MIQSASPFTPWAIVEIPGDYDSSARRGLVEAAYRSSERGVVGLVLRGVSRQTVDQMLNDIVSRRINDLKGVVYLDTDDEGRILAVAARARVVVAATTSFRKRLVEHGIAPIDPRDADFFLGQPAQGAKAIPA